MKKSKSAYLFILPYMSMFLLFLVLPTLTGFYLSFTDYNGVNFGDESWVGLTNYINLVDKNSFYFSDFWKSMLITFRFCLLIVPACIFVPLFFATLINSLKRGKKAVKAMVYLPAILSVAGVAAVGTWVFDQKYGVINYVLSLFGHEGIRWLSDPMTATLSIALLTLWWSIGGNLIIYLAALSGINTDMYEAADIEGASSVTKFFKITIPSISPQLMFTTIMTTIATLNIFGQSQILTKGGPNYTTRTMVMYINDTAFGPLQAAGQAAAMGIIFGMIIIFITMPHFRKVLKEI